MTGLLGIRILGLNRHLGTVRMSGECESNARRVAMQLQETYIYISSTTRLALFRFRVRICERDYSVSKLDDPFLGGKRGIKFPNRSLFRQMGFFFLSNECEEWTEGGAG